MCVCVRACQCKHTAVPDVFSGNHSAYCCLLSCDVVCMCEGSGRMMFICLKTVFGVSKGMLPVKYFCDVFSGNHSAYCHVTYCILDHCTYVHGLALLLLC